MANKRYTRKQLKQPDEFITLSMRAWEFIRSRLAYFLLSLGVAALIIAAVWTWSYFADRRATASTQTVSRAVEIYSQPIIEDEELKKAIKEKKDDGVPYYDTREKKLKAASDELTQVVDKGGALEPIALAMRGGVRFDSGKYQEAIEDFKAFVDDSSNPHFRARAFEALGYSYEALKQYDKSLESFRKLVEAPEDGPLMANYHEGRILAKQGKKDKAAELFKKVIEKSDSAPLKELASNQLLQLTEK